MRLSALNGVLVAAAFCIGSVYGPPAFAQDEKGAAAAAQTAGSLAPDEFLRAYYGAMAKAKGPHDIEPYLSDEVKRKMKPTPDDAELGALFAEMIQSTHPIDVKIQSKKEEKDRVTYDLLPVKIPKACEDMAKSDTFSMTGSAVLVKQNGGWKVYKDYWIAESKGKDGNMKMSFGTDPDKKDDDKSSLGGPNDGPGSVSDASDYSSTLRSYLMDKWKQVGTGKQIYVSMKITPEGSVTDLNIGGEKPDKTAEDQLRAFITSAQPLPALPGEMKEKPYVWMMFDWKDAGRCISGPYFDDKVPGWVLEKVGAKPASSAVQ